MAEKTVKPENYTAEQAAKMVADYVATPTAETVQALAVTLGKSVASIRAKLVREGVYKKKEYKTKTGETVVKKDEVASFIGESLGMSENDADSLTKANKTALKLIADFIKAEKSEITDTETEAETA